MSSSVSHFQKKGESSFPKPLQGPGALQRRSNPGALVWALVRNAVKTNQRVRGGPSSIPAASTLPAHTAQLGHGLGGTVTPELPNQSRTCLGLEEEGQQWELPVFLGEKRNWVIMFPTEIIIFFFSTF